MVLPNNYHQYSEMLIVHLSKKKLKIVYKWNWYLFTARKSTRCSQQGVVYTTNRKIMALN